MSQTSAVPGSPGVASTCALCPKLCRSACPVSAAEASEASTPTGLLALVHLAQREGRALQPDEVELMSHCSGCRGCETLCELDQRPADLLHEQRVEAFARGTAPPAAMALAKELRTNGSPYGADQRARLRAAVAKEHFQRKGRVLLWPGCSAVENAAEDLGPLMAIFGRLGADHVSLPARKELPCCGAWLHQLGDTEGFRAQAQGMEQWLNRQRSVVTLSDSCLVAFDQGYPDVGVALHTERFHLAEYLLLWEEPLRELARGAVAAWTERGGLPRVAYHDPCHLARGPRQTSAPRELLELMLGSPPVDLVFHGSGTLCCGATGSFERLYPTTARAMGQRVLDDHKTREVDWLVSGSPTCAAHLARDGGHPEVMDLAGFLARFAAPIL